MSNLFINQFSEFILIHVIVFMEGLLVLKFNWKVNYTRKISHFFVLFSPYLLKAIFPFKESLFTQIILAVVGLSTLFIYLKPVRENIKIVAIMFAAFDRPEDRPYTLKWLFTQYLVTYVVAVPLWLLFDRLGHTEAIPIIILINAIGDGLAEPVGITWGRHKYKVKALFTKTTYTRSLEGSACVFVVSVLAVACYYTHFTPTELIVAFIAVPAVATLAEAKSPHTWDSPFIFLFTGITLLLIYQL